MRLLLNSLCISLVFATSFIAQATILPPNDLHLEDDINRRDANLTEADFNRIVDEIVTLYQPIVQAHNGKLKANKAWKNSTVNAMANRSFGTWEVHMYGGLARRPEITQDGFALVVCHELGHHLAGFPQKGGFLGFGAWAANEGQSDYWATQACARKLWIDDLDYNETFANTIPSVAKGKCDSVWSGDADRYLCYRLAAASHSTSSLLSALNKQGKVSFDTPDTKTVRKTDHNHPDGQCRLDTYFAGALCEIEFDETLIPKDEVTQRQLSCFSADGYDLGSRPRCWFAPKS